MTYNAKFKSKILDENQFDIFGVGYGDLVVAQIKGSDGKEDHAITIARRLVFDSNLKYALPLTRASLDLCCRADVHGNDSFVGVVHARLLFRYKPDKQKKVGPSSSGKKIT
jgi:hypothetical protein